MKDLILDRINKRFGDKDVLRDLSLVFPADSVSCVMGPSGCGKTTLMRIIAGLAEPDSGAVTGRPEKISFVFQEDRLCEDFSALANIRLVTGRSVPDDEIENCLVSLGLEGSIRRPVRELSGGMKRRVAIARALCFRPDLLILDEAFKGLDEERKQAVMERILAEKKGRIIICVTHDPAEAEFMGGKLIRLDGPGKDEHNEPAERIIT